LSARTKVDPRAGSISYVSPLARRLIGKRVGDFVDMDNDEIQILAIA
jgi:transcription elongation GreA/GreB family factor